MLPTAIAVVKSSPSKQVRDYLGGQDLRILPERGIMELQTGRTQFGRHRDDHGNWFGCSNPLPAVRHFVLADHYHTA